MYTYQSARKLFIKKAVFPLLFINFLNLFFASNKIEAAEKKPDFIRTEDRLDRALTAYELGYKYYRYEKKKKSEDSLKEALYFTVLTKTGQNILTLWLD